MNAGRKKEKYKNIVKYAASLGGAIQSVLVLLFVIKLDPKKDTQCIK